jgi:hypothetical protein
MIAPDVTSSIAERIRAASYHTKMQEGRQGPQVARLKELLAAKGFPVESEAKPNEFDEATKAQVAAFQEQNGIKTKTPGFVNGATWSALLGIEGKDAKKLSKKIDGNESGTYVRHLIRDQYQASMATDAERPSDKMIHHNVVISAAKAAGLSVDEAIKVSRHLMSGKPLTDDEMSTKDLTTLAKTMIDEAKTKDGSAAGWFYGGADVTEDQADSTLYNIAQSIIAASLKGMQPE